MAHHNDIGRQAEKVAYEFLLLHGLKLIERNFKCHYGEIDLIMLDQSCLVFIEVRYRSRDNFGGPAYSLSQQKQQRLIASAQIYLQKNNHARTPDCRFDLCALTPQQLYWLKSAFVVPA